MEADRFDVVIIGGGPAGLSAALVLGRCRRRVVVVDAGKPRNRRAGAAHGVFTRDGEHPLELVRIGRQQLAPYGVVIHDDEATNVHRDDAAGEWIVETRSGRTFRGKKAVLATGVRDRLPDVPGVSELFGASIHVCPYCDGWEEQEKPLAALACNPGAATFALGLLTWSSDVVLFTNGERLSEEDAERLRRNAVGIREEKVVALEREGDRLLGLRLENGEIVPRGALFVHLGQEQVAPFALDLGCKTVENGSVLAGPGERAGPPGLFIAGDASHDLHLVAIAMAEGVKAACAINQELRRETQR